MAQGRIVDGDQVLGILALERLERDALPGGLVVSILSNGGLQGAVEAAGGEVVRTPVGDKYILEGMQVAGAMLGGEKSGHVIVLEHTTSGDGIVTALEVLRVMTGRRKPLAELAEAITLFPQQQRAVKRPSQGSVGGRSDPPARDRRCQRTARQRGAGARPAVRYRARVAGDGGGPGRDPGRGAGRRARDPRGGASKLAPPDGMASPRAEATLLRAIRPSDSTLRDAD